MVKITYYFLQCINFTTSFDFLIRTNISFFKKNDRTCRDINPPQYKQDWDDILPFATFDSFLTLTLRGLSLFFKILPISNTGDSITYILAPVHFLYPKLGSFSDMDYYFH